MRAGLPEWNQDDPTDKIELLKNHREAGSGKLEKKKEKKELIKLASMQISVMSSDVRDV